MIKSTTKTRHSLSGNIVVNMHINGKKEKKFKFLLILKTLLCNFSLLSWMSLKKNIISKLASNQPLSHYF